MKNSMENLHTDVRVERVKLCVKCCLNIQFASFSLQASERKAYNPKTFCRTYTMDKQPLNTGEQKDMTEFFTDLIGKIEEMSPTLVRNRYFQADSQSGGHGFEFV